MAKAGKAWREGPSRWAAPTLSIALHVVLVGACLAVRLPTSPAEVPIVIAEWIPVTPEPPPEDHRGPAPETRADVHPPTTRVPSPVVKPTSLRPAATVHSRRSAAAPRAVTIPPGETAVDTAPPPSETSMVALPPGAQAGEPASQANGSGAAGARAEGRGQGEGAGHGDGMGHRLKDYLAEVRRIIQRELVYPPAARRLGLQGSELVRFAIAGDGRVALDTLRIVGGDDESLLREGALKTIERIGSFGQPPEGPLTVELPVVFSLIRR